MTQMQQTYLDIPGIAVETKWTQDELNEQKIYMEFAAPGPGTWTMPAVGEIMYVQKEGTKFLFVANFVPPHPGLALTQEMVDQIERRTDDPYTTFQCLKP